MRLWEPVDFRNSTSGLIAFGLYHKAAPITTSSIQHFFHDDYYVGCGFYQYNIAIVLLDSH